MLNRSFNRHALIMNPQGSLNKMPVNGMLLHARDPLVNQRQLTGVDLVSRRALIGLLHYVQHPSEAHLRQFISEFDGERKTDQAVLNLFSHRFAAVIKTARSGLPWLDGDEYAQRLKQHWQSIKTLTLSGGLTTGQFGLQLAEKTETLLDDIDVISSPWGGYTALFGLAQTIASEVDILVMDFGATGVKRAIAHKFGNQLTLLPELAVRDFKVEGLVRRAGFIDILAQTRQEIGYSLDVAISLACYLQDGHPFDYRSGIYHRLSEEGTHLTTDMNDSWLAEAGLGKLLYLEHDSTAAALAFQYRDPAMMVTLGTGLGSAPCPELKTTEPCSAAKPLTLHSNFLD